MRYLGLLAFAVLSASNAWDIATAVSPHRVDAALDVAGLVIGGAGMTLMLLKPSWFEQHLSMHPDLLRLRDDPEATEPSEG